MSQRREREREIRVDGVECHCIEGTAIGKAQGTTDSCHGKSGNKNVSFRGEQVQMNTSSYATKLPHFTHYLALLCDKCARLDLMVERQEFETMSRCLCWWMAGLRIARASQHLHYDYTSSFLFHTDFSHPKANPTIAISICESVAYDRILTFNVTFSGTICFKLHIYVDLYLIILVVN